MRKVDTRTEPTSTVHYPRPVHGGHAVAVAFSAWGPQPIRVTAASDGGRDNKAHVAVRVGDCLTYVYDQEALASHHSAWKEAAKQNSSIRLPANTQTGGDRDRVGHDLALVCNLYGRQGHTVVTERNVAGIAVITVTVGAVTVRIHSSEALRCYLEAWTQAAGLTAVFERAGGPPAAAGC